MCETRALHDLGDHFRAQVMYSLNDPGHPPLAPWLSLSLGQLGPTWTPCTTLETAAALRALADELDDAWTVFQDHMAGTGPTGPVQPVSPVFCE